AFDIGRGLGIGAGADGVLLVIQDLERDAAVIAERADEARDGPVPRPLDRALAAVVTDLRGEDAVGPRAVPPRLPVIEERHAAAAVEAVALAEGVPDLPGAQLLAGAVGDLLDDAAEGDLEPAGELQAAILLEDPGDPALPRLAVDADHRLV